MRGTQEKGQGGGVYYIHAQVHDTGGEPRPASTYAAIAITRELSATGSLMTVTSIRTMTSSTGIDCDLPPTSSG